MNIEMDYDSLVVLFRGFGCDVLEAETRAEYIEQWVEEKVTDVMYQKEFLDFGTTDYTEKTRAVIKVQDGCSQFCSYCIVAHLRGAEWSRPIDDAVIEIDDGFITVGNQIAVGITG